MANTFKNAGVAIGTSATPLYTAPAGTTGIIHAIYISNVDGKKLDNTYKMAWYKGLKTTYYLRAIGATSTEMATVDTGSLNAVETNREENMAASQAPKACSILDPDCEACQ